MKAPNAWGLQKTYCFSVAPKVHTSSPPVMSILKASHLGFLTLLAFVSCKTLPPESTPVAVDRGSALLRVRVGHMGCEPSCHNRAGLELSARVQDPKGLPWTHTFSRLASDKSAPEWSTFEVPVGSRVALSVFAPPHPLVEKWIDIDSSAPRDLTIELEREEKLKLGWVQVDMPSSRSPLDGSYTVVLIAKATGHILGYYPGWGTRRSLELPRGSYEVEARGFLSGGCGNGAPRPESFVACRKDLDPERGAVTFLEPKRGSILQLHVVSPDGDPDFPGMEFMDSPDRGGQIIFGQNYAGDGGDLMRACLVSLEDQKVYELSWGWDELQWVVPWDRFPPDKDVYQIVPVPLGRYELIVWGPNMAEYHEEVTLGPERSTKLRISALPAEVNP